MSDEGFVKEAPPPPSAVEASQLWAQAAGMRARQAGLPPTPPPEFAMFSRDWRIGWQSTTGPQAAFAEACRERRGDV
jgi:hypothetical protein